MYKLTGGPPAESAFTPDLSESTFTKMEAKINDMHALKVGGLVGRHGTP